MISIQELEREREQIMDVFEEQLNVVLEVVPDSSYTRSPTPCESVLDSPTIPKSPSRMKTAPSRSRPTTRDSQMSSMSRLTQGTQMSMMGAMRQGAEKYQGGGTSFMSGDLEGRAYERSDYVSQRIAAIQAKVCRPSMTFADNSSKPHYTVPAVCEPSACLPISRLFPMTRTKSAAPIHPGKPTIPDPEPQMALSNPTRKARVTATLNILPRPLPAVLDEGELPRFSFAAPITTRSAILPSAKMEVERKQWPNSSVDLPQSKLDEAKLRIDPLPHAVLHLDGFRS
jgi:hypothetical protein